MQEQPEPTTSAEAEAAPPGPIVTTCQLPGYEGNELHWKRTGWRFEHARKIQQILTTADMAAICGERLVGWRITGEDGEPIPYAPYEDPEASADAAVERAQRLFEETNPDEAWPVERRQYVREQTIKKANQRNLERFDPLPSKLWLWMQSSFVEAYGIATNPFPESSSPSSTT